MIEWFKHLDEKYQIMLLSSIFSIFVTLLTLLIGYFLIPRLTEKRSFRQRKIDTFKNYAKPIIQATESFIWRLVEIFENRETYLFKDCPKNDFNTYKFHSTVYRLCSILGWLRASRKEFNFLEPESQKQYEIINTAIKNFEIALADGKHMELEILTNLCNHWGIDLKISDEIQKQKLAARCEDEIFKSLEEEKKLLAYELSEDNQIKLLKNISDLICTKLEIAKLKIEIIKEKRASTILETSRIESWIYRDWQYAIGDLMTEEITGFNRKFDVIGFIKFEELINPKCSNYKWIEKVCNLFYDLNISIPDKYDARIAQLKKVYYACIDLLEAFASINTGQKYISEKTISDFKSKKL